MRKFRLLKDLPGLNAGFIFELNHKEEAYITPGGLIAFDLRTMLNFPDWFEEVLDEQPKGTRKARAYVWDKEINDWKLTEPFPSQEEAENAFLIRDGVDSNRRAFMFYNVQWPAIPDPDGFYPGPR